MFESNKGMVLRECDRLNETRGVMTGSVSHTTFFHRIQGDLLISGYLASNLSLITDLVLEYLCRKDMPTILLSCHPELFGRIRGMCAGAEEQIAISDSLERKYQPFYGLGKEKLLHFIHRAAELLGYHTMIDRILQYASAALNIVAMKYPVSLPALSALLLEDDDRIAGYALTLGLNNMVTDVILANHEAGICLRRICEKLSSVFDAVADPDADTKYDLQSGTQKGIPLQALYTTSAEQALMNEYLKEELAAALKKVNRIRVIVDELEFVPEDVLLRYLFSMKRQGRIELIYISRNAKESTEGAALSFSNVVLSGHDQPAVTEELSQALWGTYLYSYPVPNVGKPPALIFTPRKTVNWAIATQERLRVRAADLFPRQGFLGQIPDQFAVKTAANEHIYLVPSARFLSSKGAFPTRATLHA